MSGLVCHFCGARVTRDEPIPREGTCDACGGDLRSCRNCRHWDERYHNQCTEPQADPVEDRTRRNFCEFFYFSRAPFTAPQSIPGLDPAADARAKLDALFGGPRKGPAAPPALSKEARAADARAKLDALFRKPPPGDDE